MGTGHRSASQDKEAARGAPPHLAGRQGQQYAPQGLHGQQRGRVPDREAPGVERDRHVDRRSNGRRSQTVRSQPGKNGISPPESSSWAKATSRFTPKLVIVQKLVRSTNRLTW
jgi:hypothetical protein